jgi:hypothetical protein
MSKKRIFTVGFALPGSEFEYVPFNSDQSLLDADIVLFKVGYGNYYATKEYQGELLFDHTQSASLYKCLQHWRSELLDVTDAGKLAIVFLTKPLSYFRYTGEQQFSGTGRSRQTTNMVNRIESYSAVPNITSVEAKSGREVRLTTDGLYLSAYWKEFEEYCQYEAFIEGVFTHVILTTKTGGRTVAAAFHDKGVMLFLPPINYDEDAFINDDADDEDEDEESCWTPEAKEFGKRLLTALTALEKGILCDRSVTPPPAWALDLSFLTSQEASLHVEISKLTEIINEFQIKRTNLEQCLEEAGSIRALLYAQGKPLEHAVREALGVFGFSAVRFDDGESEFDVIFEAPGMRCIGEVEGKDNKAISIEKFSQLERNIQEDYARDDVTEFAKGVLFGNAERLTSPSQRGEAFTAKCITAAKRAHVALVRTPDMFDPVRYLRNQTDEAYAEACREAIMSADGKIVIFPKPPISSASDVSEGQNVTALGAVASEEFSATST